MKEDLIEIIEEDFDVETYSATVCYSSSFGSGGSSSSFGSALSVSSSSSFGSPRNNSFYGTGIGSPSGINPSGPLASPFEIKKIVFQEPVKIDLDIGNINLGLKIDLGNVMEQNKYLQSALDLPKISSKFGAPVSLPETKALSDIVNQGMPAIPSSLGSAGNSFGLQDAKQFQFGYDLPGTGTQLRLHGSDENTITHGHIRDYERKEKPLANFNGFEAIIAIDMAEKLGFKKFDKD